MSTTSSIPGISRVPKRFAPVHGSSACDAGKDGNGRERKFEGTLFLEKARESSREARFRITENIRRIDVTVHQFLNLPKLLTLTWFTTFDNPFSQMYFHTS